MKKITVIFEVLVVFLIRENLAVVEADLNQYDENTVRRINETQRNERIGAKTDCEKDIDVYKKALINKEVWALKMLYSSTIPAVTLKNSLIDEDMFTECSNIVEVQYSTNQNNFKIRGQYCTYSANWLLENQTISTHLLIPICVPSSCDAKNVEALFQLIPGSEHGVFYNFQMRPQSIKCYPIKDRPLWDPGFAIVCSLFLIYLAFIVVCTILDLNRKSEMEDRQDIAKCFSLHSNTIAIVDTQTKAETLPYIQGMRVLTMLWIMILHEYYEHYEFNTFVAPFYLMIAPFGVDTFLTITGFLLAYQNLKKLYNNGSISWTEFYIRRYIRLTPTVAVSLVFTIFVLPKIVSDAIWETDLGQHVSDIADKWWCFILYIENFFFHTKGIFIHLWYLAVDMQLFVTSPFILYFLWKKPKLGLAIIHGLLIMTVVITLAVVSYLEYPDRSISYEEEFGIFVLAYLMPFARASPWLIGLLLGYEILNNRERKLGKFTVMISWMIFALGFAYILFCATRLMGPNRINSVVFISTFAASGRILWGAGVAWVVFASFHGYAGPVSRFLSMKIFWPFAKISFNVYVVHFIILQMKYGSPKMLAYYPLSLIFQSFLSNALISFGAAGLISVLFELPMVNFGNYVLKKLNPIPRVSKSTKTEEIEK